jgi:hypothetical protein
MVSGRALGAPPAFSISRAIVREATTTEKLMQTFPILTSLTRRAMDHMSAPMSADTRRFG